MIDEKINILSIQTNELSFGGDETRLLNQCRFINKDAFNFIVCTPIHSKNGVMAGHYEKAQIDMRYVKVLPYNLAKLWKPIRIVFLPVNMILFNVQLLRIINKEKIHVIDGRLLGGGVCSVILKLLTRLPVIATIYHPSKLTLSARISRYLMRFSDVIICDSLMRTQQLMEWIGKEKTHKTPEYLVIPSPVELHYSHDEEIEEIRKNKLKSSAIIIAQIASIIYYKGQDILIEAFSKIASQHKNAELWIVGLVRSQSYYNTLIDRVKELKLDNRVRFISYADYIGNIFRAIDIQVHASRYDSLPNSILEGMSVGKPLIASQVGGIPEMIIHNQTGLTFDHNDTELLANYLDQLIVDEDYRNKLGSEAKKRFEQNYSPALLSRELENVFRKLYTNYFN